MAPLATELPLPTTGQFPKESFFSGFDWLIVLLAAAIFLACIVSPPSLMDDVDGAQPQIARNMITSGDWVTPRLDGIAYMEKPPLKYWLIAGSFLIFGVHDWSARLPLALAAVALCWVTYRMGRWAFSARAGVYAGVVLATCVGLFLFTRVLIADVLLSLSVTFAMWAFLRCLDEDEQRPRLWAALMAACIGSGLLIKGLIAAVFPIGGALLYLALSHLLLRRETWKRLRLWSGVLIVLAIAAPWHVLATLHNPPYFYFGMRSGPGQYHGFFWFYFFNEHLLRFLNRRYPHDYNTVPRLAFWLFHLLWSFPWSAYFPALFRLSYKPVDRGGRVRLLALCWSGFLLLFFSFSSTQEYYSMPCYAAFALLLGCAMAQEGRYARFANYAISGVCALCALAVTVLLARVWKLPTPGDISNGLAEQSDSAYTLSLGHMGDLTLNSFAYLRTPLLVAGIAFLIGAVAWRWRKPVVGYAVMMVVFFHAARLALVVFDPYLSSKPLAEALMKAPPGRLIEDDAYYSFSSVFFYANRSGLLLNGRKTNLEYGSYEPGAPDVWLDDDQFVRLWLEPQRSYLLIEKPLFGRLQKRIEASHFVTVADSGGKLLLTNHASTD